MEVSELLEKHTVLLAGGLDRGRSRLGLRLSLGLCLHLRLHGHLLHQLFAHCHREDVLADNAGKVYGRGGAARRGVIEKKIGNGTRSPKIDEEGRGEAQKQESTIIVKVNKKGEIKHLRVEGTLSRGSQPTLGRTNRMAFEKFRLPDYKGGVIEVGNGSDRHVIPPSPVNGECTNEGVEGGK